MKLKVFVILLFWFGFINYAIAQETSIVISTSGPAKFNSHWLDEPPRLVVEFQSRNILSKIGNEVIVNQGVIKRITSSYFGGGQKRSLKSLTFELLEKVPYKLRQENDVIIIDIQAPFEGSAFSVDNKGVLPASEASNEKSKAMDLALIQAAEKQLAVEVPTSELTQKTEVVVKADKKELTSSGSKPHETLNSPKARRSMWGMIFWLLVLTVISGLGFFVWRRNRSIEDKKVERLKSELQEKDKRLEQEEIIRKAIEKAAIKQETEFEQFKDSFEALKDGLVKKGVLKRELLPEEKEKPWISGKSQERRQFPRASLTKDYSNTIILRIESQKEPSKVIKTFAENITFDGLCFGTKRDFEEKEPINLRLFFFGDSVPMIKIQGHIVWKKTARGGNYYGVYFDLLEEKDKTDLNRFIESKMVKGGVNV